MVEIIRGENLTKTFKWKKSVVTAIKNVYITVGKGETVGLWGPSGAGKTTLLHILGTLEKPTSGRLYFMGEDITDLSEEKLAQIRRENIGFVFQFHHLLPELSAIENVMIPLLLQGVDEDLARERGEELLREVGLGKRLHHRPGELSGGERQRVAVVRALISEPALVLADEPTGDLDSRTGNEVFSILLGLNRKKNSSLVIATHNEKLLADLDRVVEIIDGEIVKDNTD